MLSWLDGEAAEQIEEKVRAVAPTLRWLVDNEISLIKDFVSPAIRRCRSSEDTSARLASTEHRH
jgi:hypothetical protein